MSGARVSDDRTPGIPGLAALSALPRILSDSLHGAGVIERLALPVRRTSGAGVVVIGCIAVGAVLALLSVLP